MYLGSTRVVTRELQGENRRCASWCLLANMVRQDHSRPLLDQTITERQQEEEYKYFSEEGRKTASVKEQSSEK